MRKIITGVSIFLLVGCNSYETNVKAIFSVAESCEPGSKATFSTSIGQFGGTVDFTCEWIVEED